ncbi:AlbA family DNA-binding domain-containing protein [Halobacterium hubeiense]|uniref:AlbA family DNA-binding domain-containing protein n=1 Tax=Halobacterium hubeiense TaxID=1407499 RepID=UPI0015C5F8BC|nr:ATP-binding protein [Halobacterium hubeiense]
MGFDLSLLEEQNWSKWYSILPPDEQQIEYEGPGILRICHSKLSGIHYVGHTQDSVQNRVGSLGYELDSEEMPYTNPFSAAPCLWAIQQELGDEFFVSYYAIDEDQPAEVLEDAYLALYRMTTAQTPTANFGRMFPLYSKSSSSARGIRGERLEEPPVSGPVGAQELQINNIENVLSNDWLGFDWSGPVEYYPDRFQGFSPAFPSYSGIFRVWEKGKGSLEAVGTARSLNSEIASAVPDSESDWLVSYAQREVHSRSEIKEIESLLSGAHYLATNATTTVVENREEEIRDIIEDGESAETEFKRQIPSQKNDVVKELISLANAGGGQLILGVDDEKEIVGLDDVESVKELVSDLISGNANENLPTSYETVEIDGVDLLEVSIEPAYDYPFSFKRGQFFTRNGPQRVPMQGSELREWFGKS